MRRRRTDTWLIAGMLAGPLLWLIALECNYALSVIRCKTIGIGSAHAITIVSALVAAAIAVIAFYIGSARADRGDDTNTVNGRVRWMGLAGLGLSLWFALSTIAMELPMTILQRCAN